MKPVQLFLAAVVLLVATASFGQQSFTDEPGIPAFTTAFPVEHGFINLANGNLHIEIPIASYAQRGNIKALHARLVYDSRFWTFDPNAEDSPSGWQPNGVTGYPQPFGVGWRLITGGESGTPSMSQKLLLECSTGAAGQIGPFFRTQYSKYQYQEPDGTVHRFPSISLTRTDINCGFAPGPGTASALASDNSGFRMDVANFNVSAVYAPDGTKVFPALQDTNGNFYTESVQTVPNVGFIDHVVDTLGREPVIASFSVNPVTQIFLDYLNPQGARSRATVSLVPINLATQFGTGGDYTGTLSAVQSISFLDGSSYQFQYDSYGQITSMTLPTGGQVTYGYTNQSPPNQNRWLTSRTVDGNTWTFTPSLVSCTAPCNPLTITVTTPPYNDGTTTASDNHVYSFFFASANGGGGAWPAQIQYFRGAASGVPVVTLTKEYDNGTNNSCQHPMGNALTPVLIRETLTWPLGSGTLSKKGEYCYDNYANVTATKEWDYQPNGTFAAAPDREIDNVYHTDSTLDAAFINANLIRLLKTSTTFNGAGTQVAQSSFGYDETAFQPSGITTQHVTPATSLGNQTSISRSLNTTGGTVTSTTKWFDTGEVYQAIDPKSNPTTIFYDSTGAYPNKTCNPKNQCSYFGYDFNTGLLASSTDVNGSALGDPAHTTTNSYDTMLRPLCTTVPDGGQTCISYLNPNLIQKTIKISSTLNDISSGSLDGLGRINQTLHTTPAGTVKIDTRFDPVGAVSTVSNPYFTLTDPTYGIVQTFHDALGRGVKVIRQDGSVSSNSYSVRNSATVNGICATATDEAGNKRTSCNNGFGELREVDEPGASYPGAQASGSIDIGPIETTQVGGHPASQASGSITISGSERSKTTSTRYCAAFDNRGRCVDWEFDVSTVYDAGTVSVTANGHTDQTPYGQGDDVGTIANRLAGVIRTSSPYVDYTSVSVNLGAVPPNATISLISRTASSATNYPLSATYTFDSVDFTAASFTTGTSGSTLTGGTDASAGTPVTDHGTVTMTAGSFTTPAISYGPGTANTTSASVATALASALSVPGSGVTAATNGATGITITATAFAASGNSVSVATHPVSADPTDFPSPSFSVGSIALSGGADPDPSGLTLPFVTLYSYDPLGNLYCAEQHGSASTGTGCPTTPPGPTDAPMQPDPNNPWRRRLFAYDSLSRMRWASNPETGAVSYQYDNNGNVITKTDARGILINYSPSDSPIDSLNRVTKKTFSNGDAPVTFTYDIAPSNAPATLLNLVGRLSGASVGNVSTVQSYDAMGRIATQWQCTPLNCGTGWFRQDYGYNLAGGMATHVFDSGFTITQGYDSAGRISQVTSSLSDAQHPATLASVDPAVGFYPNDAFRKITFGNGLTRTSAYNNRLQPCRTNLNSSNSVLGQCSDAVPAGNIQDFNYGFNAGAGDNGSLASFSAVGAQAFNRTYSYDKLSRLTSMSAPGDACSGLGWQYDAWANRNAQSVTGGSCRAFQASATAQNQLIGPYQYDASGDMTNDGVHAYTYDAENRVTKVDGGTTATYLYDAVGRRVQKVTPAGQTNYFLDLDGNTAVEKDQSGAWLADYIYLTGSLLAQYKNGTTYFFAQDHLGSTRLMTGIGGTIFDSMDYLPFGEQTAGGTGTTHKFTGKERDAESGLDYFGARFDSSAMGRFMSPDTGALHFSNPQSLNRYPYALDNPLRYVDPDGKASIDSNLFWKATHLGDYRNQLIAQWGADARAGKPVPDNAKWGAEGIANMYKVTLNNPNATPNPYEAEAYGNSLLDAANKNSVKEILDSFTSYLADPHTSLNDLTLLDYALDGYLGRNDTGDLISFLLPERFVLTWFFVNHLNTFLDDQNELVFRLQDMVKQAEERLRKQEEKEKEEEERMRKADQSEKKKKKKKTAFNEQEY